MTEALTAPDDLYSDISRGALYKFNEGRLIEELRTYIDATYSQHYASDKKDIQTFELIAKYPERGLSFAIGNVMKYADRFGYKDGMNRKDLLKMLHYGIFALYAFDNMEFDDE